MRRTFVAASIAAGVLATSLVAGMSTASADPGDPAFGWRSPEGEVHRDVAVSGSGRVYSLSLPEPGEQDHSWLERGRWLEWERLEIPPVTTGGMIAGSPGDYAMAVAGNESYVFNGTGWDDPVPITAQEIGTSKLVSNTYGDAALLWSAPGGRSYLSRLERGGSWVTQRVPSVLVDVPRDVAINNAGKVTVVWAAPKGATAEIRRTVIQAGATTWSPSVAIGTVDNPRPRLRLVTEGGGRGRGARRCSPATSSGARRAAPSSRPTSSAPAAGPSSPRATPSRDWSGPGWSARSTGSTAARRERAGGLGC